MAKVLIALPHALDIVVEFMQKRGWGCACSDEEVLIEIETSYADCTLSYKWCDKPPALLVSCEFDLPVPASRSVALDELIARINREIIFGHFDRFPKEEFLVFSIPLVLAGVGEPAPEQLDALMDIVSNTCERFYPAFLEVMEGSVAPKKALTFALMDAPAGIQ